jgi:hypothetical protein
VNGEPRRRLAPLLGGLAVTAVLLAIAFSLGSWGYKYRRWLFHQGRLERILKVQPSAEQVRLGLEGEGGVSLGRAATAEELGRLAARWSPSARDAVVAKGGAAGSASAFSVGEMVYFVFFDRDGKMIDFLVAEGEG